MKAIYKIINIVNGKFYLGSSIKIKKRKSTHFSKLKHNNHHCIHLQRAYNKYGKDNFIFEIINSCDNCLKEEQVLLNNLDWSECYNISKFAGGGDNISNHPNKEEIIKKLTLILDQNKHKIKPRFKKENGNWKGGKTFCQCGTRINSNTKTCIKCQNRNGVNNPFFGKIHSDETKLKLSDESKQRGYMGSQEKAVIIDETEYKSVSFASRELLVTPNTIINRIRNNKFPKYRYKNECLTTIETTEKSGKE